VIVVADSSPLIALAIIESLQLLDSLYQSIYAPQAVFDEVTQPGKIQSGKLKEYLESRLLPVKNILAVAAFQTELGPGESEAIVCAMENKADYILLDDHKARKTARLNGLPVVGSIGVLILAKRHNLIPAIKPYIDTLRMNGIWISSSVVKTALSAVDESL
jgi:predicted nucleic acid-binding protein